MNAEVKAKWLAALRSGEYRQGRGILRSDDTFCCLGVLCDISSLGKWENDLGSAALYVIDSYSSRFLPPNAVAEWAGLGTEDIHTPVQMNDNGLSFAEIADYVEAHL